MDPVQDFLKKSNLQSYWPIFNQNAITSLEILCHITPDLAKELIQPIGDRIVFLEKIAQIKAVECTDKVQLAQVNVNQFTSDSVISESSEDQFAVTVLQDSDISVDLSSLINYNKISVPITEKKLIELPSETTLNSQNESDVEVQVSETSKKRNQSTDKENRTPKRLCKWIRSKQYENLNLKQILQEHIKGDAVLLYYNQHGFLNGEARGILLDIIANHMLKISMQPSPEAFALVSQRICELFPNETEDTYYFQPYTNGPFQKNAAGKLVDKIRNIKTLLRKLGAIPAKRSNRNDNEEIDSRSEDSTTISTDKGHDESIELAVRWLKISREPWPDVLKNWEITYNFRQKTLLDKRTNKDAPLPISAYYEEWEVLSLPEGYTLLELDFRKKYPEKDSAFVFAWEQFMSFLQALMKEEIKDTYGKKLLKKLNEQKLSLESASALILYLLPHMIPPKDQIKCDSKKKLKANISEARNAFILHASVPGDLIPAIERRQKIALKLKKRVQPFVAVVGPSIEKFTTCYVVIDNIKYKFDNIVKAFDVCFKAIHALHTEYSYEARGPWLFVQQALYGIYTSYDQKISAVAALVKSFRYLCNTSASEIV